MGANAELGARRPTHRVRSRRAARKHLDLGAARRAVRRAAALHAGRILIAIVISGYRSSPAEGDNILHVLCGDKPRRSPRWRAAVPAARAERLARHEW